MALPQTVTATVTSPISGTQTLSNQSNTLYSGVNGSFSNAVLTLIGGAWALIAYDSGTPYVYIQNTPNPDDPTGVYTESGGSGVASVA